MRQLLAPILAQEELWPGASLLWVETPPLEMEPGQFFMVGCGEGALLRRPLSIHQAVPGRMAFLFQVRGRGTAWLSGRRPGEALDLLGPLGRGFALAPQSKMVLLAAGGMGVAPLAFLTQRAREKGLGVVLLHGARDRSRLYPPGLLPPGVDYVPITEDGSAGRKGLLTQHLKEFTPQADQVMACGPGDMYRSMAKMTDLGKAQVSLEVRMGCGFGVCLGCTIPTHQGPRRACRDGPVFPLDEVLWQHP